LVGQSDGIIYNVDCGTTYTNVNPLSNGIYTTAPNAMACFTECDATAFCGVFSFEKGLTTNNCYMATYLQGAPGLPDVNAESGVFSNVNL